MDYGWEEEALCCVCVDLFIDPVMLECGHNVCRGCAEKVFAFSDAGKQRNEAGSEVVSCPQCRGQTVLTDGIGALKTNITLKNIVDRLKEEKARRETAVCGNCEEGNAEFDCEDCNFSLCTKCKDTQHAKGGYKNHKLHPLGTLHRLKPKLCKTHKKELDLYNKQTGDLMCVYCLQLSGKKMELGSIIPLPEAVELAKKDVSKEMETLQAKLETLKEVSLDNRKETERHQELVKTVRKQFGELIAAAKNREEALVKQIEDMEKKSGEKHREAVGTLKELTEHIAGILEKFRRLSEAAHHVDLLKAKDMLVNRLRTLARAPIPDVPATETHSLSCTLPLQKLTTCIESVTVVSDTPPPIDDTPLKTWKISLPEPPSKRSRLSTMVLDTPAPKKPRTSIVSRSSSSASSAKLKLRI